MYKYTPELLRIANNRLQPNTIEAQEMLRGMRKGEPIILLADALVLYEKKYRQDFDSPLSEDRILGPAWLESLIAARTMLSGSGDFSAAVLDEHLLDALEKAGYDQDVL